MQTFDRIISDRGSKYAVSGGPCRSPDEARIFIKNLCRKKKFAKATHNTWAFLQDSGPVKNDDGEAGAGMVIARMLGTAESILAETVSGTSRLLCGTTWIIGQHDGPF
jgi:putative IMPACT (imprinted ancient) family translation regulator